MKMKKIIALIVVLSMLAAFMIPVAANPGRTGGFTPAEQTFGAFATAEVIRIPGNMNQLNITIKIDDRVVAAETFMIPNNSSGLFTVGTYKVWVSTTGNTDIDNIFIVEVMYAAAKEMMADWLAVYLRYRGNGVYSTFKWSDRSNNNEETGFWQAANVFELLNTAFEHTRDPIYKTIMDGYRDRFLDGNFSWSRRWHWNNFTDDLLWWSNAFTRTYMLTGDESYLELGEEIFEFLYERAWDDRGPTCRYTGGRPGGLLWQLDTRATWQLVDRGYPIHGRNEKNIATNGNGVINAAWLAQIYGPESPRYDTEKHERFLNMAEKMYDWMYEHLVYNHETGRLWDNFQFQDNHSRYGRAWQFSYNYGLFAGAAYEMWRLTNDDRYLNDARLILGYGWRTLTLGDGLTFRDEGGMDGGDGASFRLVLARYTGRMVRSPEFADFMIYLQANAYQTWNNRRPSDGLVGTNSTIAPLPDVRIPSPTAAFGPTLQWYSAFNTNITYGFEGNLISVPNWGENGIFLAEQARRANVNFTHHLQPGAVGVTHSVFWDSGGADNNPNGTSRFLEFPIYVSESGEYELSLRWFTRTYPWGNTARRMRVNNGPTEMLIFIICEENVWTYLHTTVHLREGINNIRIWNNREDRHIVPHDNWLFLDYIRLGEIVGEYVEPLPRYTTEIYLVQNAVRGNGIHYVTAGDGNFRVGGLSSGHSVWWNANNASQGAATRITFNVNVPQAGRYELSFGWFTRGNDNFERRLIVNGVNSNLRFQGGGYVWTETHFEADLTAGNNTISLEWRSGQDTWLLLDHLAVRIPITVE